MFTRADRARLAGTTALSATRVSVRPSVGPSHRIVRFTWSLTVLFRIPSLVRSSHNAGRL